jgi:hypothetical protein
VTRRATLALGIFTATIAAATIFGCGEGHDIDLGAVVSATPLGPPVGPTGASCGDKPCANHSGDQTFVEPSASETLPDAFDAALDEPPGTDSTAEPALVYPSDETLLPVNFSTVRFAWSTAVDMPFAVGTRFALDFLGPQTRVRVVTADTHWVATEDEWAWIAESNRGGRVDVVVRALDSDGQRVWRSRPVALFVSSSALEGTVYYWSTGSRGLMQALASGTHAARVFSDPSGPDAGTCTGCHTVSRDGKRLAAGYDKNQLAELALDDGSVIVPLGSAGVMPPPRAPDPMAMAMTDAGPAGPTMPAPKDDKPPPAAWSTFSPDGRRLLLAGGGQLHLIDADSGAPVGADAGAVHLPAGMLATHPDWSPLGDRVAVTLASKGGDKQTEGGSIALIPFHDDTFDEPQVLPHANVDKDNNFFPSFSPDGRFIAYVTAQGGSQEATSARLRLVELATGVVNELTRLNERVKNEDGIDGLGNTMPTWGPLGKAGTYWLTFSSLRAYSDVRPQDAKQDQLWIAGLDPNLDDPGYAAFWAPFQNLGQGNHRAFWTPVAPEASCCGAACRGDPCAERETCDDGLDDDCDCVVDDCSVEVCDNGVDDDGDGKSDKMDLTCAGP